MYLKLVGLAYAYHLLHYFIFPLFCIILATLFVFLLLIYYSGIILYVWVYVCGCVGVFMQIMCNYCGDVTPCHSVFWKLCLICSQAGMLITHL